MESTLKMRNRQPTAEHSSIGRFLRDRTARQQQQKSTRLAL
jgi:hypothetical protein